MNDPFLISYYLLDLQALVNTAKSNTFPLSSDIAGTMTRFSLK